MSRASTLPPNHPLRLELANEVHARPTEGIDGPSQILYLALASDGSRRDIDGREARALFERLGVPLPEAPRAHHRSSIGSARLILERHNEFIRYTAIAPADTLGRQELTRVSTELAALSGQVIVATRLHILGRSEASDANLDQIATRYFDGNVVVGAALGDGAASAITDFQINAEGYSQIVVLVTGDMRPRQMGRMVQRLLELDTYRMMALLSFPAARALRPEIEDMERELSVIASDIARTDQHAESALLERLTRLEAHVQQAVGASHFRFSASAAYEDIVMQRIADLREQRIEGLQTFQEFTARRLAPAMSTCRTTSANLKELSHRVAQATNLLSIRVDIVREAQSRELLAATARRAKLQLRLQRAVEGLSVVAVSYYVLGVVSYAIKGLKAAGANINADLLTAVLIPVVFAGVAIGLGRMVHRKGQE
jgi:uncharacterized membrane-anchored protein